MTGRFLYSFETAVSLRKRPPRIPKGVPCSKSRVMEIIRTDIEWRSRISVPLHPKTGKLAFIECSMPKWLMRPYKQEWEAHPAASNFPPMWIVERGTVEHLNAAIQGGWVFIKEDPQNPTILAEEHPLKGVLQGQVDRKQS